MPSAPPGLASFVSLFPLRQSLNIFSQIGLVMLIGLVTKNAILLVEFANQLREQGLGILAAVEEAARIRLRPILRTSFSTAFGILPIALGLGAGAESRQPLGIAIVGGVLFSTFFTLLVVPVVYSLLARYTRAEAIHFEAMPQGLLATWALVPASLSSGSDDDSPSGPGGTDGVSGVVTERGTPRLAGCPQAMPAGSRYVGFPAVWSEIRVDRHQNPILPDP